MSDINPGSTTLLGGSQPTTETAPTTGADGTYSSSPHPIGEGLSLTDADKAAMRDAFKADGNTGVEKFWREFHAKRAEQTSTQQATPVSTTPTTGPNDVEGIAAEAPVGSVEHMAQMIGVEAGQLQDAQSVIDQQFGAEAGFTAFGLGEIGEMVQQCTSDMENMERLGTLNENLEKGEKAVRGLYRDEAALADAVDTVRQASEILFGDQASQMLDNLADSGAFDYSPTAHQRIVSIARQVVSASARAGR